MHSNEFQSEQITVNNVGVYLAPLVLGYGSRFRTCEHVKGS